MVLFSYPEQLADGLHHRYVIHPQLLEIVVYSAVAMNNDRDVKLNLCYEPLLYALLILKRGVDPGSANGTVRIVLVNWSILF